MNALIASVVSLVVFLCYREWYHSKEVQKLEDRYFEERQRLLDRLMSRDFAQYKQAEYLSKLELGASSQEGPVDDFNSIGV